MKKMFAIILIVLLICLAGFAGYYAINLKGESVDKEETSEKTEEETKKENMPKEDEPYENETTLIDKYGSDDKEKEVDLKYDQYITANGYAGAADNVYYTRNGVLYHLVVSTEETTKLAEGVKKIESDLDCMRAYKDKDFKLIKEDEYVEYVE